MMELERERGKPKWVAGVCGRSVMVTGDEERSGEGVLLVLLVLDGWPGCVKISEAVDEVVDVDGGKDIDGSAAVPIYLGQVPGRV